jgi:hypothetical protein
MEKLDYKEQLEKLEADLSCISLEGSEKQIKYAVDILKQRVDFIKHQYALKHVTETDINRLSLCCSFIRNILKIKKTAKFWIEEKDEPIVALSRFFKQEKNRALFTNAGLKF